MSSQLDHPETWTTGSDAATEKQKAFLCTLATTKGVDDIDPSRVSKGEASQKIDELKNQQTKNPDAAAGQPIQDPDTWATGGEKATGKQEGYIAVMAKEAGEKVPGAGMGKTEASKKIEELKGKTGM